MTTDDYKAAVRAAVLGDDFLSATFSRPRRKGRCAWTKIIVRPVEVKGQRTMQFSFFDSRQATVRNAAGDAIAKELASVLDMPFGQILVQTASVDVQVRVSKGGDASILRRGPSRSGQAPDLSHDRTKKHPLPAEENGILLFALGIVDKHGKVRAGMRGKFTQINEFLREIDRVLPDSPAEQPVQIVDCGCGSAYLTFAAYYYLNNIRKIPTRVTGVDHNRDLIAKCRDLRGSLMCDGMDFRTSAIADFAPAERPDIVLSLHACDTATDEALARGVRWESRAILAAPCCQHELHDQLTSEPLRAVLRYGIFRERLADILTDTFRALALRIVGYRTSIVEFVSPESTSKNLMIRAELGVRPGGAPSVRDYLALKEFWNVTPAIETMLGGDLLKWLEETE